MKDFYEPYVLKTRKPLKGVHPIFINRHSPRVFAKKKVTQKELLICLEAARWAPSNSNLQPWRCIVSRQGTPGFEKQYELLNEFNKKWTKNASYLITLISYQKDAKGKKNRNATSDTGAAWENFALQAADMDIVAHGMGGYSHARARKVLQIPDDYRVEFMIAVGRRTPLSEVPQEYIKGETPNTRRPLKEIVEFLD
jgi:nitroreductase